MQSQKSQQQSLSSNKYHSSMNYVAYPLEIVFESELKGAEVYLIGGWSKWQKQEYMKEVDYESWNYNMNQDCQQQYTVNVSVPVGEHRFKFIVNGQWKVSYHYQIVQNDFGEQENIVIVYPAICCQLSSQYHNQIVDECYDFSRNTDQSMVIRIAYCLDSLIDNVQNVKIKGSWDNWNIEIQLDKVQDLLSSRSRYEQYLKVPTGKHCFKYIVDGDWKYDPNQINEPDNFGGKNNIVVCLMSHRTNYDQQFQIENLYWNQIDCPDLNFAAIQGHSMDLIADTIFIFGGFYHNNFLETVYELNVATLEVTPIETKGKQSPDRRAYHGSTVIGQLLLIYGGLNERNIFNDLFILDTIKLVWTKINLNNRPPAMERCSFTNYDNRQLLVFGGYYCSEDLEFEENYNQLYCLDLESFQWHKLKTQNTPEERYSHTADTVGNKFFVFGGIKRIGNSTQMYNDLYLLDLQPSKAKSDSVLRFEQVTDYQGKAPSPRYAHSSFVINSNQLGIFGGRRDKNMFLNDVFIFCTVSRKWTQCEVQNSAPQGRCFHGSVVINNNEVVIFGGQKANSFLNVGRINAIYSLKSDYQSNLRYFPVLDNNDNKKKKKTVRFI